MFDFEKLEVFECVAVFDFHKYEQLMFHSVHLEFYHQAEELSKIEKITLTRNWLKMKLRIIFIQADVEGKAWGLKRVLIGNFSFVSKQN
jgi:hypothetical protein